MPQGHEFPDYRQVEEEAAEAVRQLPLAELTAAGVIQSVEDYYLLGTYPPLKAMGGVEPELFLPGITDSCGVYVHIPFCEQRCTFCHFAKEILPESKRVDRYLAALSREFDMVGRLTRNPEARTVYFGGGTPSYLSAQQITALFSALSGAFKIAPGSEVTFELHPSVIGAPDYRDRLDALAASGVNRWVFGVQSMDDRVLRKLNRGHTAEDVRQLLSLLAERDLSNVSVDLIFGLPHQTLENWYSTIRTLVEAGVEKFNVFPLMFKEADPISAHYRREPGIFPDAGTRLLMHFMLEAILRRLGFRRGPLFYYAKADQHSRQQEDKYDSVEEVNLLPFGVSGFGYVNHTQYYNVCTLDGYMAALESGRVPIWRGAHLNVDEQMRRTVMFGLRSRGVDRSRFRDRFRVDPFDRFAEQLRPFFDHGLLDVDSELIQVTDRGAPFADSLAVRLASRDVIERVRRANTGIGDRRRDPVERYDYSPIGRGSADATA